jgi:hypothetical protein
MAPQNSCPVLRIPGADRGGRSRRAGATAAQRELVPPALAPPPAPDPAALAPAPAKPPKRSRKLSEKAAATRGI